MIPNIQDEWWKTFGDSRCAKLEKGDLKAYNAPNIVNVHREK